MGIAMRHIFVVVTKVAPIEPVFYHDLHYAAYLLSYEPEQPFKHFQLLILLL